MLRKIFYIIGGLFLLIIISLVTIPFIFKDEIKAKIDTEIKKNVNAKVYFSANDFSLSLFKNFPNLAVTIDNFGVVNNAPFDGDTLVSIQSFKVVVDIMSVINGEKMIINEVYLGTPRIKGHINKEGKPNWDIYIGVADTTKPEEKKPDSPFSMAIQKWQITNGYVSYVDKKSEMSAEIKNLNHEGKGDLTADIFDLVTKTTVDAITYKMGKTHYLNNNKLDFDITLAMDMANAKYTFKENTFRINDFALGMDGWVALPDTNVDMDIRFKVKETEFKHILSLVPMVFMKDFDKIKTEGTLAFDGFAKGRFNNSTMPAFGCNLKVDKAMFQYPDLPTPVKNITIDLNVDNKDGIIDNMSVLLKKFHLEMGANPVDASLMLKGLTNMNLDAIVKASVNLEEITKIFPVAGITAKGDFSLNANAKGVYNKATGSMPAVEAGLVLKNGYVKTKDFPSAVDKLHIDAKATNPTGKMADTKVNVSDMSFSIDGQPFNTQILFENLDNYTWDVNAKGIVDLTKIMKIFPVDGMNLSGIVTINSFTTKGQMADLTAKKFDKLPTSGSINFDNFEFKNASLPQGFKMTKAAMTFDPKNITVSQLKGFVGKSDIDITGSFSNYIAYVFSNETIKGSMNFNSQKFDVNEWISKDPAPATPTTPAPTPTNQTAVEIPKNIDFVLKSSIKELLYDKMIMSNFSGGVIVKDGEVKLDKVVFGLLDGDFKTSGFYSSKDIKKPLFNFDLNIKDMNISKAYENFNTVKSLAPAAKNVDGEFSMLFKINGVLGQDMMPVMNTVSGAGVIDIADAKLKNLEMLGNVAKYAKKVNLTTSLDDIQMKDVHIKASIKDGRVTVQPFDMSAGTTKLNLGGSQGLDGTLDYIVKMDVPAGAAGQQANTAINSLTGKSVIGDKVKLDLKVTGPSSNPKITPIGGGTTSGIKDAVTDKAKQELEKKKKEAEEKARQELERVKQEGLKNANAEKERLQKEAQYKLNAEKERLRKEAEDKLKNKIKLPGGW